MAKVNYVLRLRLEQVTETGESIVMSSTAPPRADGIPRELGDVFAVSNDAVVMGCTAEMAQKMAQLGVAILQFEIPPNEAHLELSRIVLAYQQKRRALASNRLSQN